MRRFKQILRYFFAAGFVVAGALDFLYAPFYLRIMPPVFPAPLFLIYLSGAFEIALGVLLAVKKFTRVAAYGLIALLVAVFPANVFMWMHHEQFPDFSETALALRLPLQLVLIGIVFWLGKDE